MSLRVATAFALSSAAAIALNAAAYLAAPRGALWLASAGWTIAALVAVVGLGYGVAHVSSDFGHAWTYLVVGSVFWLLAQIAWDVYPLVGSTPPLPSVGDIGWLLFAVCAAIGLYRFTRVRPDVSRIALLDVVAVGAASSSVLVGLLYPSVERSTMSPIGKIVALAYPILYCGVLLVALETIAGVLSVLRNAGVVLLVAGIVFQAVAFTWWSPLLLSGSYVAGHAPNDVLWTVGEIAIGVGGFLAASRRVELPPVEEVLRRRGVLASFTFVVLSALLFAATLHDWNLVQRVALQAGVAFVGTGLLFRAWIMSRRYAATLAAERRAQTRLARANEELEAFAYAASHDLKAPLVSIQGFAASLTRRSGDVLDDRARLYIERIESNAEALQRLIDDMLGFARTGIDEGAMQPTDADAIVRALVREFRERYGARGATIELASRLPFVATHPARFRQAVTNLIENAVTHSGDTAPHIRIFGIVRDETVEIAVEDDGVGVDPADRERIFQTFTRGRRASEASTGGTGLGLALVKKIAEASGGSVRYEPAQHGGARFVLSLPKGIAP